MKLILRMLRNHRRWYKYCECQFLWNYWELTHLRKCSNYFTFLSHLYARNTNHDFCVRYSYSPHPTFFEASVIYLLAVFLSSFPFFFLSLSFFFRRTRYCTQIGWTSWRTRTQFIVPTDYEKRRDKYIRFEKRRDACRMAVAWSEAWYRKYSIWYFRRLRHVRLRWAGNRVHGWCTLDTGMRQNWFSGKSSRKVAYLCGYTRLPYVIRIYPRACVFEGKNDLSPYLSRFAKWEICDNTFQIRLHSYFPIVKEKLHEERKIFI